MVEGYGGSGIVRPVKKGAASVTAQKVALLRLGFERADAPYGDPESDLRLGRDVASDSPVDSGTPMGQYLAARTTFFDRVVVGALERGVTQAVIVGAGYDGRAFRYAKPGVTWFEVDHPDTQRDKRARIERLGIDAEHVKFISADFALDDVAAALQMHGFDPGAPTIFICEGVAVYLDRSVLVALLRAIRSLAATSSRLAISLSLTAQTEEAAARQEWFRARVAAVGEPERDRLTPEEMKTVLADTGWRDDTTSPRAQGAGLVVLSPI
jgi:methyltransferase (TIGR00027 family)